MSTKKKSTKQGVKKVQPKRFTVKLQVTEDHIKRAKLGDPRCCVVARALHSAGYRYVRVGHSTIDIYSKDYKNIKFTCANSKKTYKYIKRFDAQGKEATKPRKLTLVFKPWNVPKFFAL